MADRLIIAQAAVGTRKEQEVGSATSSFLRQVLLADDESCLLAQASEEIRWRYDPFVYLDSVLGYLAFSPALGYDIQISFRGTLHLTGFGNLSGVLRSFF